MPAMCSPVLKVRDCTFMVPEEGIDAPCRARGMTAAWAVFPHTPSVTGLLLSFNIAKWQLLPKIRNWATPKEEKPFADR